MEMIGQNMQASMLVHTDHGTKQLAVVPHYTQPGFPSGRAPIVSPSHYTQPSGRVPIVAPSHTQPGFPSGHSSPLTLHTAWVSLRPGPHSVAP